MVVRQHYLKSKTTIKLPIERETTHSVPEMFELGPFSKKLKKQSLLRYILNLRHISCIKQQQHSTKR
ncbi:hypothetical protein HJC23_004732 [Cyclotella cryptica]|uniref:Uncharacterized protein n=1 Tax=Cyclotella cryptica TaxID=29204 RepID=A0ABD3NS66_9STRA